MMTSATPTAITTDIPISFHTANTISHSGRLLCNLFSTSTSLLSATTICRYHNSAMWYWYFQTKSPKHKATYWMLLIKDLFKYHWTGVWPDGFCPQGGRGNCRENRFP